jgi:YebC/PmpR family DNA-binding regulatory protein
MAGHSKWANIKRKKEKEDSKRGKLFTRMSREISVIARAGGGDIQGNARLRLLVDKARAANMPNENIDRAIKRGTGALEGAHYEEHRYEGYAPHSVAVVVETLSDNKNRTIADIRHYFNKHGGRLGTEGSVLWMFNHKGQILLSDSDKSEDDLLELLLEAQVDDVIQIDEGWMIVTPADQLDAVRSLCEDSGLTVAEAEVVWMANNQLELNADDEKDVADFLDGLSEMDDVREVFASLK